MLIAQSPAREIISLPEVISCDPTISGGFTYSFQGQLTSSFALAQATYVPFCTQHRSNIFTCTCTCNCTCICTCACGLLSSSSSSCRTRFGESLIQTSVEDIWIFPCLRDLLVYLFPRTASVRWTSLVGVASSSWKQESKVFGQTGRTRLLPINVDVFDLTCARAVA